MKRCFFIIALVGISLTAAAESFWGDVELKARLGYSIGGTAPLPMPATIRSLNNFYLRPNLQAGIDAKKRFNEQWGLMTGLHLENKAMKIDANVKNYGMEITRGDQRMAGRFTGSDVTRVQEWMLTLPIAATFNISEKVSVMAGPYASLLLHKGFDGYAYDGYLRVDDPTGAKVEIGHEENTRGSYEFDNDMRHMQFGIMAGADWQFARKFGAYAELNWGLTGIHHSDFKTVEQTLYPIFGTIGITYKIK